MSLVVRCRANDLGEVPESFLDERRGFVRMSELPLTVGRSYVVFAITNSVGGFWYYVLDDDDRGVPLLYPSAVFDVEEAVVPTGWVVGHGRSTRYGLSVAIGPVEWASDSSFYERLYDGDEVAVEAFQRMRSDLDG
jgi:hypothetical protein